MKMITRNVPLDWTNMTMTIEASTLGLPPGRWPNEMSIFNPLTEAREEFTMDQLSDWKGVYHCKLNGRSLHVFND